MQEDLAFFDEGVAKYRLGDFGEARRLFEQAIELDPHLPGPWRRLAVIAHAELRFEDCIETAASALCLNPTSPHAATVRAIWRQCEAGPPRAASPPMGAPPPKPPVSCDPLDVDVVVPDATASPFALVLVIDRAGHQPGRRGPTGGRQTRPLSRWQSRRDTRHEFAFPHHRVVVAPGSSRWPR